MSNVVLQHRSIWMTERCQFDANGVCQNLKHYDLARESQPNSQDTASQGVLEFRMSSKVTRGVAETMFKDWLNSHFPETT